MPRAALLGSRRSGARSPTRQAGRCRSCQRRREIRQPRHDGRVRARQPSVTCSTRNLTSSGPQPRLCIGSPVPAIRAAREFLADTPQIGCIVSAERLTVVVVIAPTSSPSARPQPFDREAGSRASVELAMAPGRRSSLPSRNGDRCSRQQAVELSRAFRPRHRAGDRGHWVSRLPDAISGCAEKPPIGRRGASYLALAGVVRPVARFDAVGAAAGSSITVASAARRLTASMPLRHDCFDS